MMIGEAAGINQLDAQLAQALLEALRLGDAGNHPDAQIFQEGERHDFVREDFLEVKRLVRALDELGVLVVAAQLGTEFGEVAPVALRDENDIGAAELLGWFAQKAARQQMAVGEGRFAVDENDVDPFFQAQKLQAVVEQQRVAVEFADGVEAAFDPVLVDQHKHILQVRREHERFVACHFGIEQKRTAIGNDPGRVTLVQGAKPIEQLLREGGRRAFITAAEHRDLASALGQFAREEFHHGCFAGATYRQIADTDDKTAERVDRSEPRLEPPKAPAHHEPIDAGKHPEKLAKGPRAKTPAALQYDIDGKLFESIKAVGTGSWHGLIVKGTGMYLTTALRSQDELAVASCRVAVGKGLYARLRLPFALCLERKLRAEKSSS